MTKASSSFDHDLNQPSTFDHVAAASRKRLFAVFYEPVDGLEAVAALPSEDLIPGEQTWLFHGQEGVRRLDASGVGHGAYGRLVRMLQITLGDDNQYMEVLAHALHQGALLIALPVADIDTADRRASILQENDGQNFADTQHLDFVPMRVAM